MHVYVYIINAKKKRKERGGRAASTKCCLCAISALFSSCCPSRPVPLPSPPLPPPSSLYLSHNKTIPLDQFTPSRSATGHDASFRTRQFITDNSIATSVGHDSEILSSRLRFALFFPSLARTRRIPPFSFFCFFNGIFPRVSNYTSPGRASIFMPSYTLFEHRRVVLGNPLPL